MTCPRVPGVRRAATVLAAAVCTALAGLGGCGDGGPQGPVPDDGACAHIEFAGGVDLVATGTPVFHQFGFQTNGEIRIPLGGTLRGVEVTFLDGDGNPIVIPANCDLMRVETSFLDPTIAAMQREPGSRWIVDFTGNNVGTTTARVEMWHLMHRHFQSEPIQVTVVPAP